MTRQSISRRLMRGLTVIGIVGTILLFAAVVFFYHFSITDFRVSADNSRAIRETLEHVVLPVAILMGPVAFVVTRVIGQAFLPLEAAARKIEAARGHERGFRIDTSELPTEALPFTDAVNDLLERLDEAAVRQEAFAADVAHELRTPLALLALELDQFDDDDAVRLKEDVMAMRRLIDQLMLLAQIDAFDAAQIALEQVPLVAVARDVVTSIAPAVITAGRTIDLKTDAEEAIVRGRREAIAAALRNLVENAVRATPIGGAIHVRVGPGLIVSVSDDGPGLSPDRLRALARRHCRADHASNDGAGLGLAIVERIMAAHGGRLETHPEKSEISLNFSR
jgi:signal transduction histidine kinase